MKIPTTNLEQKCLIIILLGLISAIITIPLGLKEYGGYVWLAGIACTGILCFIAYRKKWISKEAKL